MNLLIVDDNRGSAEALYRHAQLSVPNIQINVFFASTLAEAKKLTLDVKPLLTFLDIGLPDATPSEVAASIILFTPPVIVVSGYSPTAIIDGMDKPIACAMKEAGAREYLQKASARYEEQIASIWISILVGDNMTRVKEIITENPSCLTKIENNI